MTSQIQSMTPKEIVSELDKYIIGQDDAKKSVAIALRNRYRRSLVPEEMREEIMPKNILMMGPTGCGKTEIARRLAKLMKAPFVKVEATKFTEVGYVGRDVDSMIRDLVEASIRITKASKMEEKYDIAETMAEEKIIDAMIPNDKKKNEQKTVNPIEYMMRTGRYPTQQDLEDEQKKLTSGQNKDSSEDELVREQIRQQLKDGLLDDQMVEIEVESPQRSNQLDVNEGATIAIGNIFGDMMPKKTRKRRVHVSEAKKILREQEAQNLLDMDQVTDEAVENAEQNGIVFIDEIDKIASGNTYGAGADVSREGVQRDILPIVEGTVVNTKYGPVKTDHILFIGAGAFQVAKPTDLIPELQGRFPIRVELTPLTEDDFEKILTVPKNALVKQHQALLATEGINLEFTDDAIREIAHMAFLMNDQTENIGARRLDTIMERLLETISYEIPENDENGKTIIDKDFVRGKFEDTIRQEDMNRYIL